MGNSYYWNPYIIHPDTRLDPLLDLHKIRIQPPSPTFSHLSWIFMSTGTTFRHLCAMGDESQLAKSDTYGYTEMLFDSRAPYAIKGI